MKPTEYYSFQLNMREVNKSGNVVSVVNQY